MTSVTVNFTLDSEKHASLLRWLKSLPRRRRSDAIREILQAHLSNSVTLSDVYQAVRDLDRKLQSGTFVVGGEADQSDAPDEPPDVAANLDNLGL